MKKTKLFRILFTEEQMKILEARTMGAGYNTKSSYVRSLIFMKKPLEEQLGELINEIKSQQKQNHKHFR